jgi:hypothetical protein
VRVVYDVALAESGFYELAGRCSILRMMTAGDPLLNGHEMFTAFLAAQNMTEEPAVIIYY